MQLYVDPDGSPTSLEKALNAALTGGEAKSLLVLTCDANGFAPEDLDPILKRVPVPMFGGIFPNVYHQGESLTRGSVVIALESEAQIYQVSGMSDPAVDFEDVLDAQVGDEEFKTLMVFVDGLSARIDDFVEALYAVFGLEINYVGGGAGSSSFAKMPCLISNDGLKEDCAVLAALDMVSGVGVRHGWSSVGGPFKVTESEGNVIKSLDWRPAFEVYKEVVESHSGHSFDGRSFLDISMGYPFGIAKLESERVVRDPVAVDGNLNLVCVGGVPEGEYVDILHGQPDDLIRASGQALELASKDFPANATPGINLFIDCISRKMFLGERYADELAALTPEGVPNVGICTVGEVANSGKDYLEFYNKTSVVTLLEDV